MFRGVETRRIAPPDIPLTVVSGMSNRHWLHIRRSDFFFAPCGSMQFNAGVLLTRQPPNPLNKGGFVLLICRFGAEARITGLVPRLRGDDGFLLFLFLSERLRVESLNQDPHKNTGGLRFALSRFSLRKNRSESRFSIRNLILCLKQASEIKRPARAGL